MQRPKVVGVRYCVRTTEERGGERKQVNGMEGGMEDERAGERGMRTKLVSCQQSAVSSQQRRWKAAVTTGRALERELQTVGRARGGGRFVQRVLVHQQAVPPSYYYWLLPRGC